MWHAFLLPLRKSQEGEGVCIESCFWLNQMLVSMSVRQHVWIQNIKIQTKEKLDIWWHCRYSDARKVIQRQPYSCAKRESNFSKRESLWVKNNEKTRGERGTGGGHDLWMCGNKDDDDKCGIPRCSISRPSSVSRKRSRSAPLSPSQPCKYNKPVALSAVRSITTKQELWVWGARWMCLPGPNATSGEGLDAGIFT